MDQKQKQLFGYSKFLTLIGTHNSHVGDARATESNQADKINISQLIHERFGLENTYNIGFTTYTGTVTAADSWDMDADFKRIRSSPNESIEFLLHDSLMNNGQYFFLFRSNNPSIQLSKQLNDEFNEQR